jgi:NAD(P)-dependent dehydrogenase (short-subunit alcohol dehydrogenase family)
MSELEGRTAVITGASRGLGAALAEDFARRGMKLGLCARSQPVLAQSDKVVSARLDVADEKAVDAFALEVEERLGPIDLWINNAGVLEPIKPLRDVTLTEFREHIDVNLTGLFLCTRAFVRHLHRRREADASASAVLINVSSGAAWHGYAGWAAYCAGKSAVDRLTECVQLEEEQHGLRAYAVAPGVIDTDMQTLIRSCTPEAFPEVERFVEMKRDDTYNTPGFVAEQLLGIAFDAARRPEEVAIKLPDEKPRLAEG